MKILFLTYQFCGATQLAEGLAKDLGYTFIEDPMSLIFSKKRYIAVKNGDDEQSTQQEIDRERPYIFPNDVPNNTIVTHNVKTHKLPGNRTEDQFLAEFEPKFDKVIIIRRNDVEMSWKLKCVAERMILHNSSTWREFMYHDIGFHIDRIILADRNEEADVDLWDDSWIDNDIKNSITNAHIWLDNYGRDNNKIVSYTEDLTYNYNTESGPSIEQLNTEISRWGIDSIFSGITVNVDERRFTSGEELHNNLTGREGNLY